MVFDNGFTVRWYTSIFEKPCNRCRDRAIVSTRGSLQTRETTLGGLATVGHRQLGKKVVKQQAVPVRLGG